MTEPTGSPDEPGKTPPEGSANAAPAGDGAASPCEVDAGGAVVGYNPRPANSAHDKAALARYMEQWRARRQG